MAEPFDDVTTGDSEGNTTLCATTGIAEPPGTEQPWPMRKRVVRRHAFRGLRPDRRVSLAGW